MPRPLSYSSSWDLSTIPEDIWASEHGRRNAAKRSTFGRPKSDAPRCPCAAMTLKRAQARGKSYEHDPTCAYYPCEPRALVV